MVRRQSKTSLKYVHDLPGDNRIIVLLHGFLSSKTYWRKLIPLLSAEGYRVISIDLLGFGHAPKPKHSAYTYSEHVAHIHSTLEHLGVTQPVIMIGHSMGSLLAMRYAQQHPPSVANLCLVNPPMYTHPAQAHATLRDTNFIYRLLLDSRYRHILWVLLRNIGPFASHTKYSREGSLENVISLASFFSDLKETSCRTLLLIGKKDRKIYIDNIRQKSIPDNVHVIIEASGHHTPVTHAKELAEHIRSFLA